MNQCHFLGNLTRDPELKETSGGKKVVNFGFAVNRRWKKGNEYVDDVAFLECEAWDTGAETIEKHCGKGQMLIIHCSVKQENWEDKESGQKRSRLKFRVNSFEFVPGGKKKEDNAPREEAPAGGDEAAGKKTQKAAAKKGKGGDDDIPF